ncbi:uncharacterized protein LOC108116183 [Drosophila eugracilis]|uniref:uncharacterized protein LOC108116183 n=1 Tax=Drosophila eugracilis TaxID=29029 RepID=UPI001BDAC8FA|nr:uncharacterized protein LOC108116183 [Drosophila eugracilis]
MKDCISVCGGEFQLLRVTPDLCNEVKELLVNISVNHEFGCLITNLKESPLATSELGEIIRHILSLGISFAIRHVESGIIVAGIANIIFNVKRKCSYYDTCAKIKSPNMLEYIKLWDAVDVSMDINELCQVDSTADVEYMGTLPEFRRRGLANILCQHTIDFVRLMSQGKLPPDVFAQLPNEMQIERPKAVVTIATSVASIKLGHFLGMQVVHKWHFSELRKLGRIAESIDKKSFEYAELQIIMV